MRKTRQDKGVCIHLRGVDFDAVFAAAREAAIAVEDESGDADGVDRVGGPAVERVGDDAVGAAEEEEVGEWGLEDGGVGEGRGGHVDGGDGVEALAGG